MTPPQGLKITSKGSFFQATKQKGQALVVILLFTVGTILLSFAVINNAILVNEKMELQNAADAAAFSVSTLEARDLNFSAYTNRAMVANEVAMGQIVGLMSWAVMINTISPTLDFYLQPLLSAMSTASIGVLSFVQAGITTILSVLKAIAGGIFTGMKTIAPIAAKAIYFVNLAYSGAQRVYHIATLLLSGFTLAEILDANDVQNFSGASGPQISGFGFVALAGHFVSHYPDLAFTGNSFITSYAQDGRAQRIPHSPLNSKLKPNDPEQLAGMERFAALVNASRDNFSRDRAGGWTVPLLPPIDISANVRINIPLIGRVCILCFNFQFRFDMNRRGGSDLRYQESGGERSYGWSAADTTTMDLRIRFSVNIFEIINFTFSPPSAGLPVGIGAAQAASTDAEVGSPQPVPVDNMRWAGAGGEVEDNNYGGSPGASNSTWILPFPGLPPTVQSPSMASSLNNINKGNTAFSGHRLPRYNDTKLGADPISLSGKVFGFESPYLIIGLTKPRNQVINLADPDRVTGSLELADSSADDEMAVIAKSEVYFSRPNTLSYFMRSDGRQELANAFNPYWNARLVDTTMIDRATAIAMQQKQLWLPSLGLGPVIDDFFNLLNWLPTP